MSRWWIVMPLSFFAACVDDGGEGEGEPDGDADTDSDSDADADADINALRAACVDALATCQQHDGEREFMCSCYGGLWTMEALEEWVECEATTCNGDDACQGATAEALASSSAADDFYWQCKERDDECDTYNDGYCVVTLYRDDVIADKMDCLAEPCGAIQSCFEAVNANWGCPRR